MTTKSALHMLCAALIVTLTGASCFNPESPDCSFRCDESAGNAGHCPEGYSCRDDGYCHREGHTGSCPFSPPDLSAVTLPDLAGGADLASSDGPRPDLRVSFDMAMPACGDGVMSGDETDVDCGGIACNKCEAGKKCTVARDCSSGVCLANVCAAVDMALPIDMANPADMAAPVDLARPVDLSVPADLARPVDMVKPVDLVTPADLAQKG